MSKRHRKNQNLGKFQIIFNKMITMEKKLEGEVVDCLCFEINWIWVFF